MLQWGVEALGKNLAYVLTLHPSWGDEISPERVVSKQRCKDEQETESKVSERLSEAGSTGRGWPGTGTGAMYRA